MRLAVGAIHVLDVVLRDLIRAAAQRDRVADGAVTHFLRHCDTQGLDFLWRPVVAAILPRDANRLNAGVCNACNGHALALDRPSLILEVVALGYQLLARQFRVVLDDRAFLGFKVGDPAGVALHGWLRVAAWVLTKDAIFDLVQDPHIDRVGR